MLVLPSLLAVAVWFTKPPQGAQARITVMNESAKTTFQIVGIDKTGLELSPGDFTAQPDQLTVGPKNPRQTFIRFNPDALWAVCAVSLSKSEAKALNNSGAFGELSMRMRSCKRYSPTAP